MTTPFNTITVDGKNVDYTAAQIKAMTNRAKKAKGNAAAIMKVKLATSGANSKFTISDMIGHTVDLYDQLTLNQQSNLDLFNEIGRNLLFIKSQLTFGDNKGFGQFIAGTDLKDMSRFDRNDAMYIASNWDSVTALRNEDKLDGLGVSAIRKRVTAYLDEKDPSRVKAREAKAAKSGKTKSATKTKGGKDSAVVEKTFKTEADLAKYVLEVATASNFDLTKFTKALRAAVKAA